MYVYIYIRIGEYTGLSMPFTFQVLHHQAIEQAAWSRRGLKKLIHHSDRARQIHTIICSPLWQPRGSTMRSFYKNHSILYAHSLINV
jgi:hypothetical protein